MSVHQKRASALPWFILYLFCFSLATEVQSFLAATRTSRESRALTSNVVGSTTRLSHRQYTGPLKMQISQTSDDGEQLQMPVANSQLFTRSGRGLLKRWHGILVRNWEFWKNKHTQWSQTKRLQSLL